MINGSQAKPIVIFMELSNLPLKLAPFHGNKQQEVKTWRTTVHNIPPVKEGNMGEGPEAYSSLKTNKRQWTK